MKVRSKFRSDLEGWAVQMAGVFRFAGVRRPAGAWIVQLRGAAREVVPPREFAARFVVIGGRG